MSATVVSSRGAVAAGHAVAGAAAAHILGAGGNAADAVVAAAATFWVVQPNQSGPGGDAFALVKSSGTRPAAVLGSGPVPSSIDPENFRDNGSEVLPLRGMISAAVPGEVDVLRLLHSEWGSGRFSWRELLEPAAERASEGIRLSPQVAAWFREAFDLLSADARTAATYVGSGPPSAGTQLRLPDLARTIESLAEDGPRDIYEGQLAAALATAVSERGGHLRVEDLSAFHAEVVDPLSVSWRGCDVFVPPAPSQGIILLECLGILRGDDLGDGRSGEAIHLMVEAYKHAVADRLAVLGDPRFVTDRSSDVLSESNYEEKRKSIGSQATDASGSLLSHSGDTTYLAVADRGGMTISYITSLSNSFGCGMLAGSTGVLLNNRAGRGFTLMRGHPNELIPGKRTIHTLVPAMMTRGNAVSVLGTPGGDRQPQWLLQTIMAMASAQQTGRGQGQELGAICGAPRWQVSPATDPHNWGSPTVLALERGFPTAAVEDLQSRGHQIDLLPEYEGGGGLQIVDGAPDCWWAASDPRVDGAALPV